MSTLSSDLNPTLPSESITSIREKRDGNPNQGLPQQNLKNGDFSGYGVLDGAVKSDTIKIGKI